MWIVVLRRVKAGPAYAALLTVLAGCIILPVETAKAQFFFRPSTRLRFSESAARDGAITLHPGTSTDTEQNLNQRKKPSPKGSLQVIISIEDQRISLPKGADRALFSIDRRSRSSDAARRLFSVISKERWHRSNIYSNAPNALHDI